MSDLKFLDKQLFSVMVLEISLRSFLGRTPDEK